MDYSSVIEIALQNILSPMILFFVLGVCAGFIKSDLEIPNILAKSLALYLVAAIGLKGGIHIAQHGLTQDMMLLFLVVVIACACIPFIGYGLLRATTKLSRLNSAALSAHYGSVSLVTYIACSEFLLQSGHTAPGYLIALLALMETPAILSGLYLSTFSKTRKSSYELKVILSEVFLNGTVILLIGSMFIGYATGDHGLKDIKPFFIDPFKGVLCFFLLDMGLLIGRKSSVLKSIGWKVVAYGLYMPLIGALIGYGIAHTLFNLSLPETVIIMTLFASASYIAVPAAIKLALPEADPSIYVTLPLGITFPLNIIIGIPLYYAFANHFMGG